MKELNEAYVNLPNAYRVVRYKAYSMSNRDSMEVLEENRLRGCYVGDPILVFGDTISASEVRLKTIMDKYVDEGYVITDNRRGSFSVELPIKLAEKELMAAIKDSTIPVEVSMKRLGLVKD